MTVPDEEARAWYEARKADFVQPEKRRVSQIAVPTKDEAVEIHKAIEAGEPFEMLVRTKSTDTSTQKKMGDLGWVSKAKPRESSRASLR